MVSLPDCEKISKICLFVLTWSTNVTGRRTDTAWQQRPRLCIASRGKNWVVNLAIWSEVSPGAILTKCGLWEDMADVIVCAIFGDCRFRGADVVRGGSLPSPTDLRCCPYNTTVWPCDAGCRAHRRKRNRSTKLTVMKHFVEIQRMRRQKLHTTALSHHNKLSICQSIVSNFPLHDTRWIIKRPKFSALEQTHVVSLDTRSEPRHT